MPWTKISASVRLVMAMFRLQAGIESNFGRMVKDILKTQYPSQKKEIDAGVSDISLGQKLMNIALKQQQYDQVKAEEAVQEFLIYITTGPKFERDPKGKTLKRPVLTESGEPIPGEFERVPSQKAKPWNFAKDFDNWEDALAALYSNLRNRSMSDSMGRFKKQKMERSIDQAYGQRGEGGGAPEGGEGRMPTPEAGAGVINVNDIGQALDDKAGVKQFIDLIDENLPDLKAFLGKRDPNQLKLFEVVFEGDVGSFGADVDDNMGQATAMKDKYPDLYEEKKKRWSGFIGDLRKETLQGIWEFIEHHLTPSEYDALYDVFYSDTTPKEVEKLESKKVEGRKEYQQGIDERKIAKYKWYDQQGIIPPEFEDKPGAKPKPGTPQSRFNTAYSNLSKKLSDMGVDVKSIPAVENPTIKGWVLHSKRVAFSLSDIAMKVATRLSRTGT